MSVSSLTPFGAAPPAHGAIRRLLAARRPAYLLHLETDGAQALLEGRRRMADLPETIALGHGAARAATLRAQADLRLACSEGTVWLTCEGDLRDHVLDAGVHHDVRRGDLLVLFGMPRGTVLLSQPSTQESFDDISQP
jgi:hypothetical protein